MFFAKYDKYGTQSIYFWALSKQSWRAELGVLVVQLIRPVRYMLYSGKQFILRESIAALPFKPTNLIECVDERLKSSKMSDKFKNSHNSHHTNQTNDLSSFAHDLKILKI